MVPTDFGQSVTAEVYCARVKGTFTDVVGVASLGADSNSLAAPQATCPAKTRLVSGGYASGETGVDPPSSFIFESRRQGQNGWVSQALRAGDETDATQFTVHAYCFKPSKPKAKSKGKKPRKRIVLPRPLSEVAATATLGGADGSHAAATTGPCSGKLKGISGGFSSSVPSEAGAADFTAAHYLAGAWTVGATQIVDGNPVSITAYEYCG